MLARGLGAGKSQDLSTAPGLIRFASAVRVNIFQNISGLSLGPDSAEFEEGLCSLRSDGKELKGLLLGEDGIQEDPPPPRLQSTVASSVLTAAGLTHQPAGRLPPRGSRCFETLAKRLTECFLKPELREYKLLLL